MMSRFRSTLLTCSLVALAFVACSPDENPVQPADKKNVTSLALVDEPTPKDMEFMDELKVGTFTICKVAPEADGVKFDFSIEAEGPGVSTAPIYETSVTLGHDECADVYQAPEGKDIDGDTVTMTELVPDGWHIVRVAIWSIAELPDGSFETTFHEYGPNTATIQGVIDAGKSGCVAIFYNELDEKKEDGECTRTPGYWKTHPEAWPMESITIGGNTYSKEEALEILWTPERGDKSKTLFRALVAAVLNEASETDVSCVDGTMDAAHDWLASYPACSGVRASSSAWRVGEPLYTELDDYNNGLLECADHCEDGDEDKDDGDGGDDDKKLRGYEND